MALKSKDENEDQPQLKKSPRPERYSIVTVIFI